MWESREVKGKGQEEGIHPLSEVVTQCSSCLVPEPPKNLSCHLRRIANGNCRFYLESSVDRVGI